MNNFQIALLVWNMIVLIIYGYDKLKAKNGGKRVRERSLLAMTYMFGGAGAVFGMILFNHKTAKMKFRILVPMSIVVNIIVILAVYGYII